MSHHEILYDHVEPLDAKLLCAICRSALVDPVTANSCKHTFCRACITTAVGVKGQCPIDRSVLSLGGWRDTEMLVKLMLVELKVRCAAEGCGQVMQRGLLLVHLRTCPKAIVTCQDGDCGLSMARYRLPHHRAYECFQRKMECKRCGTVLVFRDRQNHLQSNCKEETLTACSLCEESIDRDQSDHQWTCPRALVPCCHSARGCSAVIPRAELENHTGSCLFAKLSTFFELHDARLTSIFDTNRAHFKRLELQNRDLSQEIEILRDELEVARFEMRDWRSRSGRDEFTSRSTRIHHEVSPPPDDLAFPDTSSSPSFPTHPTAAILPYTRHATELASDSIMPGAFPLPAQPDPDSESNHQCRDWTASVLAGVPSDEAHVKIRRLQRAALGLAGCMDSMGRRNQVWVVSFFLVLNKLCGLAILHRRLVLSGMERNSDTEEKVLQQSICDRKHEGFGGSGKPEGYSYYFADASSRPSSLHSQHQATRPSDRPSDRQASFLIHDRPFEDQLSVDRRPSDLYLCIDNDPERLDFYERRSHSVRETVVSTPHGPRSVSAQSSTSSLVTSSAVAIRAVRRGQSGAGLTDRAVGIPSEEEEEQEEGIPSPGRGGSRLSRANPINLMRQQGPRRLSGPRL